ncbi:MAG: SurA N-terminal domain-containing protein [Magnetovibrio sp.]|nr:SurA N-terminal domain-containing protein [Magnetovibrio sp.]
MLILIRSKVGSIVVKAFAFLLILGFGAWGIQDMLDYQVGGTGGAVAEVGEQPIPPQEFYQDVYSEVNRMRQLFGPSFDIEQARRLGIIDAVLNRRISAAASLQGAQDLGVVISDGMIRGAIIDEPMFKGLAGNFDRTRFAEILAQNGLTEANYVARLRQDLATGQLIDSVQSGLIAPRRWVDAVYRYRRETRDVDTAVVPDANFGDVATPTDAELRKHYKANEKEFTAPEYRALTYLRLDAADLAKEMEIAEAELRESYDARADEFTTPETRRVQQMIVADEAKAKDAAAQIGEGKEFLAVAKAVANLEAAAAELGEITRGDLLPELAAPVFALKSGATTQPVKSSLGWHLLKVTEIKPGGVKTFEDARQQVSDELAREKAIDAIFDLSNQLEDQLGGGATLEEAGAALNLKVQKLAALDREGKNAAGTVIDGLPGGPAFAATAFATEKGEQSALAEAGEDGFYVMRVDGVTPSALRPFETVIGAVTASWKAERRRDGAEAVAKTIVATVNAGATLADAVAEWSLAAKPVTGVRRDAQGTRDGINPALVGKVFGLETGKAAMERVGDGFTVAVLAGVKAAEPSADADARKALAQDLVASLRADLDNQLVAALRDAAGVKVYQPTIDALFGDRPQNQPRY